MLHVDMNACAALGIKTTFVAVSFLPPSGQTQTSCCVGCNCLFVSGCVARLCIGMKQRLSVWIKLIDWFEFTVVHRHNRGGNGKLLQLTHDCSISDFFTSVNLFNEFSIFTFIFFWLNSVAHFRLGFRFQIKVSNNNLKNLKWGKHTFNLQKAYFTISFHFECLFWIKKNKTKHEN